MDTSTSLSNDFLNTVPGKKTVLDICSFIAESHQGGASFGGRELTECIRVIDVFPVSVSRGIQKPSSLHDTVKPCHVMKPMPSISAEFEANLRRLK